MNRKQELMERIASREVSIGIVGVGYVGLPLAVAFAEAGFRVVGIDVDHNKVHMLNAGRSYVEDVPDSVLQPLIASGNFRASSQYADLARVDAISICVPTPLGKSKDPDISYIIDATERIAEYGWAGKLVVLESTTYPGTTEEVILPG
jgi:UDP-N-acetyl-D-glucosamine dehydrogenase